MDGGPTHKIPLTYLNIHTQARKTWNKNYSTFTPMLILYNNTCLEWQSNKIGNEWSQAWTQSSSNQKGMTTYDMMVDI